MSDQTRQLDLSDQRVREMADMNHTPDEMWSVGGELISVRCRTCGHRWPCETRRSLDAVRDAELDAHIEGLFG